MTVRRVNQWDAARGAVFHGTEPERKGGFIQTFSGRMVYPLDMRPEDIDIEDIAHALACTARFGGHTRQFYSVAQHSVLVSHHCKPEDALWGLLHDAGEAYLGDMPRPIKHSKGMEAFRRAEHNVMCAVTQRFGLSEWEPESVKQADAAMLATEKRDLLRKLQVNESAWLHGAPAAEAIGPRIRALTPNVAEDLFLERWNQLWPADGGW